jgi:N-methylhydantoinase A/oxoprolinase/acetone carboxylase beta subunit
VGGTNTDAVLIQDRSVLHTVKTPTTADVTSGIEAALQQLLANRGIDRSAIEAVMIGTTHFTNAVVQRRDLGQVAAIRIGLPAAATLEPFVDWPHDLRALVRGGVFMVRGGYEVDGRPIVPLDHAAVREAALAIRDSGIRSVGICSVFSPLNATAEEEVAAIVRDTVPDVSVTCSHNLGRIGLLGRENVTLLNASLGTLAERTTRAFADGLARSGLDARLYVTQNDGTVMAADYALRFPVLSFASGPTNSLRGAAILAGEENAIVVDIGGTTSDIGCLVAGFPREANNAIEIGGVRTLFRMPDLLSLGLGGGSLVDPQDPERVGPESVGYLLPERARVFGGEVLTATDIGVAAGLIDLGKRQRVADLSAALVKRSLAHMHGMLADAVDRMKRDATEVPVIVVGGGGFLAPKRIAGASDVVQVPHREVANAIGAATAQVSGEVDQVFQDLGRSDAITRAKEIASTRALAAGAREGTLSVTEVEDLPLAYLPGDSLRVRVRVVGEM